jgi:hypothetical protein
LHIAGHTLPPGAYGAGFIAGSQGGQFVALDLGGNALLSVPSQRDTALARPNPLQLLPDPSQPGTFRLYAGRSFVAFTPADAAR